MSLTLTNVNAAQKKPDNQDIAYGAQSTETHQTIPTEERKEIGMTNRLIAFRQILSAQNSLERILFASTYSHIIDFKAVEWAMDRQKDALRKLYFDLKRLDKEERN